LCRTDILVALKSFKKVATFARKGLASRSNSVEALKDIIGGVVIRFLIIISGGVVKNGY
jgi:hypothetical protein